MPFRGGGQAGGGKKGSNMKFQKPAEPAFLKRFKEKVGYREHVTTIDDKVNYKYVFDFWRCHKI